MEYDGLMYYTVHLKSQGTPLEITSCTLEFSLNGAEVSQLIANTGGANFRASYDVRMIPEGEGNVWNSRTSKPKINRGVDFGNFMPQIWVGGDVAGISFSGENDKGWTPDDQSAAQELLRQGTTVIYRMNVIRKPVKVEGERSFTFILTPTPAKPMPEGWRGWHRSPPGTKNAIYDSIDGFVGFCLTAGEDGSDNGLTFAMEPSSWEAAKKMSDGIKEKFGAENPAIFYLDYSWPSPGPSMKDWNHDLWAGTGHMAWTREVEDYMVWAVNQYIERGLIDGIYVDDTSMGATFSLASSAYPVDWNKNLRRKGFNTMGFRRFCQRVWKLFQAKGKAPIIQSHMTECFEIPAFSFIQTIVNGEDRMVHPFQKATAMQVWSRDELRIMGNGPKWGCATFWKPSVETNFYTGPTTFLDYWIYWQTRAMHATIIQHDMYYFWIFPMVMNIHKAFVDFGMNDPALKFIPYWEHPPVAITGGPEGQMLAGIFLKPGKALVMISNYSAEEQKVSLNLDAEKLFGKKTPVKWTDVDFSLHPADTPRMEEAAALRAKLESGSGLDVEGEKGWDEDMGLEDKDTAVKPGRPDPKRLKLEVEGEIPSFVVRKYDYRLLQVEPAGP
ncbi:MAG: hypothetical protein HQL31_12240 [Planctomycetes bacterium]|nr:hypothetical protein [Planctomycetota bacterium]